MNGAPKLGRGPDPRRLKVERATDRWFDLLELSDRWLDAADAYLAACGDCHLEGLEPTRGTLGRELDAALAMRRGDVPFWDREPVA